MMTMTFGALFIAAVLLPYLHGFFGALVRDYRRWLAARSFARLSRGTVRRYRVEGPIHVGQVVALVDDQTVRAASSDAVGEWIPLTIRWSLRDTGTAWDHKLGVRWVWPWP